MTNRISNRPWLVNKLVSRTRTQKCMSHGGSMESECLLPPFCCLCCEVGNVSTLKHVQKWAGQKAQKLKGKCDRWIRGTWNRCAIADQIEWFFIKRRRCASQVGNGFLKSPSISLGVNGYAKIILRQRKCWVWGSMLQKRWVLLKRYLDPHKCSTRSRTPRSKIWIRKWITNLGRYYVDAELLSSHKSDKFSGAAPIPLVALIV